MTDVAIVKLGGSLITTKAGRRTIRRRVLRRLAEELAGATARSRRRWIIGHGSGSFGHQAAAEFGVHRGLRGPRGRRGVSATQAAASTLHREVLDALRAAGMDVFSVAPSSCIVTADGRPVSVALEPLMRALDAGLAPVTYGDVVMDRRRGCAICSTETALLAFVRRLRGRGVAVMDAFWLGDTEGVYDADGRTIDRIAADAHISSVAGSSATDVTGGMRHRLATARRLARLGVRSHLLDGRQPGVAAAALRGKSAGGTLIVP